MFNRHLFYTFKSRTFDFIEILFSDNKIVADWSKVASKIYSHSSSKPNLDLRLLLHGLKTPLIPNCSKIKTNHTIEVVLFDPTIESTCVQEYKRGCLGDILNSDTALKHITLDLPAGDEKEEVGPSSPSQVRTGLKESICFRRRF